jgi:hypothetical protein
MLKSVAREPENPRVVICSIHQPRSVQTVFLHWRISDFRSSKIYHLFDHVLLLARGKCIYNGEGGQAASKYFASKGHPCPDGYNVADHLLDIASDTPSNLDEMKGQESGTSGSLDEKREGSSNAVLPSQETAQPSTLPNSEPRSRLRMSRNNTYATTFLTQLQVLSRREWKILKRSVPSIDRYLIIFTTS